MKVKPKKAEPELEFVAPHSLDASLKRLQRLGVQQSDSWWHHARAQVRLEPVSDQQVHFRVSRVFDQRTQQRRIQDELLEVVGSLSALSDGQRTLVLLKSATRPFSARVVLQALAFALLHVTPCLFATSVFSGMPTLLFSGSLVALIALAVALDLRHIRRSLLLDTRRHELRAEIRRALILPVAEPEVSVVRPSETQTEQASARL